MRPDGGPIAIWHRFLGVLCSGVLVAGVAIAGQDGAGGAPSAWAARSGDAVLDRRLADINAYARRYPDAFSDELVRYLDAPRALVAERLGKRGIMPADVYYACAIAHVTGRPCRSVLEAWDRAPVEDWATVAEGLGVVPGSPQAARLHQGITDSYRRWARPLPEDPPLPRGKPKAAKPHASK
jgi:hypothetical protein